VRRDAQRGGDGSKWTIRALAAYLAGEGHDFGALWGRIQQIVAKTLISAQPMLQHQVRGGGGTPGSPRPHHQLAGWLKT
jgi:hypothetical protein